jgi:hypothetical protein
MLSHLRVAAALGGTLAIALNVRCASAVPPITLQGAPRDLEPLVGEWHGEYASLATRWTPQRQTPSVSEHCLRECVHDEE